MASDSPVSLVGEDESDEFDAADAEDTDTAVQPPTMTDVYNLVDQAEDRLADQIAQLSRDIAAIRERTDWLGQHVVPAVASVGTKIDLIMSQVNGFIQMVGQARIPGLSKKLREGPDGQAEDEG